MAHAANIQNSIPALNEAAMSLAFGRMDADYHTVDHTLQVENQDTVSGAVFYQLSIISSIDLNMIEATFIKVWKQMLLKRAQDLYLMEKQVQPPNQLHLSRIIKVPAPLAELLTILGPFQSNVLGSTHHIVPPPRAEQQALMDANNQPIDLWNVEQRHSRLVDAMLTHAASIRNARTTRINSKGRPSYCHDL